MKKEQTRRIWIFISAYGIVFAFLSWFHEAVLSGKSDLIALAAGTALYAVILVWLHPMLFGVRVMPG